MVVEVVQDLVNVKHIIASWREVLGMRKTKRQKQQLGRPKKYSNVEEFELRCSEYFFYCEEKHVPLGICGLAAYLDIDRTTLRNYEKQYPDTYGLVIKQARAKIEAFLEMKLFDKNVTGTIFNLKNNFSWAERERVERVEVPYDEYIKRIEDQDSEY